MKVPSSAICSRKGSVNLFEGCVATFWLPAVWHGASVDPSGLQSAGTLSRRPAGDVTPAAHRRHAEEAASRKHRGNHRRWCWRRRRLLLLRPRSALVARRPAWLHHPILQSPAASPRCSTRRDRQEAGGKSEASAAAEATAGIHPRGAPARCLHDRPYRPTSTSWRWSRTAERRRPGISHDHHRRGDALYSRVLPRA